MNPGGLTGIPNIPGAEQPRSKIFTLTTSDSALAIPSWAQGGKGLVYVTGCGGGSSGGLDNVSNTVGAGGSGGATAMDWRGKIPSGVTTLNVVVGAGGAAVTANGVATAGNAGGNSSITAGVLGLTLRGALAPSATAASNGGAPYASATAPYLDAFGRSATLGVLDQGQGIGTTGGYAGARLGSGSTGLNGGSGVANGHGGHTPFGGGGKATTGTSNVDGVAGDGYGAGGSGGNCNSLSKTSGAGAPGFFILEFVEGF